MKIQPENRNETFWNKQSMPKIAVLIILFLIIVPLVINGLFLFCNWLFKITTWNISAAGLGNSEWLTFWGSYFGGIATVIAVWWTVTQTEKHYQQTSDEQKKQNAQIILDKERQRRLDVLPIILLQPRIINKTSPLTVLLAEETEADKPTLIPLDKIKPNFEELDISEISCLFGKNLEIRKGGLNPEELQAIKNGGFEKKQEGKSTYLIKPLISELFPFWLINGGREAAVNIQFFVISQKSDKLHYLRNGVLSLLPREKIKLNFIIFIETQEIENISTNYIFQIKYADIYSNQYEQEFPLTIKPSDSSADLFIRIDTNQTLRNIN